MHTHCWNVTQYKLSYAQQWEFILWPSEFWHCILKMDATGFSEMLVTIYKSTPRRPQPKLSLKSIHKTRCVNIIHTPHTGNTIMQTAWTGRFILTHWSSLWSSQSTECDALHLRYNFMNRKISFFSYKAPFFSALCYCNLDTGTNKQSYSILNY
jgi:hypothetical protein